MEHRQHLLLALGSHDCIRHPDGSPSPQPPDVCQSMTGARSQSGLCVALHACCWNCRLKLCDEAVRDRRGFWQGLLRQRVPDAQGHLELIAEEGPELKERLLPYARVTSRRYLHSRLAVHPLRNEPRVLEAPPIEGFLITWALGRCMAGGPDGRHGRLLLLAALLATGYSGSGAEPRRHDGRSTAGEGRWQRQAPVLRQQQLLQQMLLRDRGGTSALQPGSGFLCRGNSGLQA
mmetsp:Transcript_49087/g.140545  ORF Transcript_49087/g.140545 Transcript_49087/m.140545 type:complete len:233 (+) Transcript_49087:1576-2274(+)